jgi:hypothetical protein
MPPGVLFSSLGRQIAFAIGAASGQAGVVVVTQNCELMSLTGQVKKSACFGSVPPERYEDFMGLSLGLCFAAGPGLHGFRTTNPRNR